MGDEQLASHSPNYLHFTLYQLRDDLAELLFGLESGRMSREQVVAVAQSELENALRALNDNNGSAAVQDGKGDSPSNSEPSCNFNPLIIGMA